MIELCILTQGDEELTATVEQYNAEELNEKLNNSEINTVAIGDIILNRFDVKRISTITKRSIDD